MGELIRVDFNPEHRMAQACEDPILIAYHEYQILGYATTDDETIADTVDRYSDEGMISELMGWYHLNAGEAQMVFGQAKLAIQDNNVE